MEKLVKYIVDNLVSNKDAVYVTEEPGDKETVIRVVVAKEDLGKVIGKGGKIAQSIRSIVKTAAASEETKTRYFVKFEE